MDPVHRQPLKRSISISVLGLTAFILTACAGLGGKGGDAYPVVTDPAPFVSGTLRPYQVRGRWYRPDADAQGYEEVGSASWYGAQFNGRPTASGERFDMTALSAAHKTLPLPALAEVTNLANGRSVVVRVNDRGPFIEGRIIDLSRGAAEALDLLSHGVGDVRVRYIGPAPRQGGGQVTSRNRRRSDRRDDPPATARISQYWVQAGSFRDRSTASLAAEPLGNQTSIRAVVVDGTPYYRVLLGPWSDPNSAERARQIAIAQGVRDAFLISDN